MTRTLRVTVLLLMAGGSQALADPPEVANEISQAMQDRDYEAAIAAIDKGLQDESAPRDYLLFLKGRTYHYQKRYDLAIGVFDEFARRFPESRWGRRARFAKGLSQARAGGFLSAEQVFRQEAEYLLSSERKQEIANIYLEFADSYFKPKQTLEKPDYAKALQFYQKALEVGPLPERKAEIELQIGQCLQELGKHAEAAKQYAQFIKDHADNPLILEARYRLGQSQLDQGDLPQARRTWQDLLAKHGEADSPRLAEAAYKIAFTHGVPRPSSRENLELGVSALQKFVKAYPDHPLASKAYLQIGLSYKAFQRFEDASQALKAFLADARYAAREETPQARFELGVCYQLQKRFDLAVETWKEYLTKHPAHQQWSQAQQMIINTEYLMAQERLEAKKYAEARNLWTAFLARYPLDGRAAQILYLMGQMNFDQKQWQAAIADWERVVSKYPGGNWAQTAQLMIGVTREEKLEEFEKAIEAYKKVSGGPAKASAQRRISRLTAKSLSIETPRIFRTQEHPAIRLTTRNLEKVTVKAYRVDLETYFRKMHLATGVEALDIALIDPDRTFEHEIKDYSQYKQVEGSLEVLLPEKPDAARTDSGVLVVTVGSDKLEATTMVLQSDLDIIVKSSRDEVFVFAQNMRTGKPWPNAKLLISNGEQVFAEAATGEDGVFQKSYEQLKSPQDVRVFAASDGHVASNITSLRGLGVAQGLARKGYIYTDRPAYRPGQIVNLRAIVRKVANDVYAIESGKKYELNVFDTRNRLVWEDVVTLNDFGSAHSHFTLPANCPQGSYRIQLSDGARQNYQGVFSVYEYKLENAYLTVEAPRNVYYRGEKIAGKIRAAYYYGAPIVGKEVRYRLGDGPVQTAKTDDRGEIAFELETREFRETQILPLTAELPEHSLATQRNYVLASRGFSLSLSTTRDVFLAGESFELKVKVADAEGQPVSRQLKLRVLEKTLVDGRPGERELEAHELTTAAATGEGNLTLALAKGATYLLRAEGVDRFNNTITGQHSVQVSGDDDTVRLRILASQHTYRVGDQAQVKVHWREQPALALVTFQGARVLAYRLLDLKTGVNELTLPMTADLAPNFELAVAVMTDPGAAQEGETARCRLHTADSPFTVERDLLVKIARLGENPNQPARPGEEIELKITTTDPQGKPVAAEVGLAMIEQALLDRFEPTSSALATFFRGEQRQTAVRTTSSITFAYQPKTRPINPQLLAEAIRLEDEVLDAEALAEPNGRAANAADYAGAANSSRPALTPAPNAPAAPPMAGSGTAQQAGQGGISNGFFQAVGQQRRELGLQIRQQQELAQQIDDAQQEGQQAAQRWGALADNSRARGSSSGLRLEGYKQAEFADQLRGLAAQGQANEVTAIFQNGVVRNYSLNDLQQRGEVLFQELQEANAIVLLGAPSPETGYWNPSIVMDDNGEATLRFTLPARSTSWKLLAKGITADTLAGEAESTLVTRKDLFGELTLPLAFTDGDAAQLVATIQNDAVKDGIINVTLKTTIGGKTAQQTKSLKAQAEGTQQVTFSADISRPADSAGDAEVNAQFELIVSAGDKEDRFLRAVPILPYGVPVFGTASGAATSDTTAWVELPENMPVESPTMEIVIGPTIEQGLLDIVLGPALRCQVFNQAYSAESDTASSDLMAALSLQKLLKLSASAEHPQASSLDARIRATIGSLVSSQRDDGGWSWSVHGGDSDRYSTARAAWALALAGQAGYKVPDEASQKAQTFLRGQIATTANDDYESKAILLHALAVAGVGDFPLANRLYRNRPSLSTAALLYLALAFAEMDRKPIADELLTLVGQRSFEEVEPRRRSAQSSLPWNHSSVELRALYAIAVQQVRPSDPLAKQLVEWLLAHRSGHRWVPDKATGPATLAATAWFSKSKFETEHYQLSVWVNEQRVQQLDFDKDATTRRVRVPTELLKKGKQRVNFQLTGRGRFSYQCIMEGFVKADQLTSSTKDWRVERVYEAAPLERDGKLVPRGFDVVRGSYTIFRNGLTQLPVGQRGHVELRVSRLGIANDTPQEQLEYLVMREPIPSGVVVVADSVQGGFERYEITPGAITFYVGSRRNIADIHYHVQGFLPGEYRAGPTVIRDVYRPDRLATHQPKSLTVLPQGAKSEDAYRLTPRELYELGKRHFRRGEMNEAAELLTKLVNDWDLKMEPFQDATKTLLDIHLRIGPAERVVRYFEIIKEKWPDTVIDHADILRIGQAYHDMGEYERCFLIYRATVESSFLAESRVAGFLQQQAEELRGINVMNDLLSEYPPEPYVAAAAFDLAQQVYSLAAKASSDPKLREKKISRAALIQRSIRMLNAFLTAHPDDPAADQASFSLAAAMLELDKYSDTIAACRRFVERYPESQDLDGYLYTIGYCHYAMGQHEQALEVCRQVSQMKVKDKVSGRMVDSQNRERSIYILGQIYHSLGEAAKAIAEYARVQEQFADAKEAIEYFARREIRLAEVSTFAPQKPVELELKFRNVAGCVVKVYRIDLMKFGLLKRNLSGITNINLAGIRPDYEASIKLGDGKDYRDRIHRLELPLKAEGAYLVVCRGDDLHASGLVLISPYRIEIQEEAEAGRVRTTIKDVTSDSYVANVHVKVIGSENPDFVTGETDLRGIFVADNIVGQSTVIAQTDQRRYAFYRGQQRLGPRAAPQPGQQTPADPGQTKQGVQLKGKSGELLKGLYLRNREIQSGNTIRQQDLYNNESTGVKAEAVK